MSDVSLHQSCVPVGLLVTEATGIFFGKCQSCGEEVGSDVRFARQEDWDEYQRELDHKAFLHIDATRPVGSWKVK
jgi:hypothetical protein